MRVFFAICSWGFGHLMRSLPIIKELKKKKVELFIFSDKEKLNIVRKALGKKEIHYIEVPEVFKFKRKYLLLDLIHHSNKIIKESIKERKICKRYVEKYKPDIIISDSRFGFYDKTSKNFFINHQLRIGGLPKLEILNKLLLKKYDGIIVPDYPFPNNLAGKLSKAPKLIKDKCFYVGHISNFKKRKVKEEIDIFVICTGPKKYREILGEIAIKKFRESNFKVVITNYPKKIEDSNIKTYPFLEKRDFERISSSSKIIISRSGYTTIMDLVELEKKALLIPTPTQLEQTYLAKYHCKKNNFYTLKEKDFLKSKIEKVIRNIEKTKGFKTKYKTKDNIKKILDILEI